MRRQESMKAKRGLSDDKPMRISEEGELVPVDDEADDQTGTTMKKKIEQSK